jgi:hypothetical protein
VENTENKLDQELEKILEEDEKEGDIVSGVLAAPGPNFSAIEVMARITDNKIETREIVDKWLLLTYDLPVSKEGNRARNEFYKQARHLGAVQNTESVYLLPWTTDAEIMAMELADVKSARVIVWTAQTSEEQSKEITRRYDAGLRPTLKLIEERIDRLEYMMIKGWYKKAEKYTIKTERILLDLEAAVVRRGSAQMLILVTILRQRFNQAFARV